MSKKKKPDNDDEYHITHEQSVQLGSYGQGMSEGLEELAAEFMRANDMKDPRSFISAQMTIMEAMVFLTFTRVLEHDERIPALRAMMISLRRSFNRYHQERELDQPRRDH